MDGRAEQTAIASADPDEPVKTRMRRALKHAVLLATALLVASCASTPNGPQAVVDVHIDNNMIPSSMITVYFVPEAGIERMIGTVVPSTRKVLQYKGLQPVGEYRLVARGVNNSNVVSSVIVMDNVAALEWSLATNLLQVVATRSDSRNPIR
jgi:PBP1b-binding outer membrane lipoprotein LpoB